jgi:hypothetical protein
MVMANWLGLIVLVDQLVYFWLIEKWRLISYFRFDQFGISSGSIKWIYFGFIIAFWSLMLELRSFMLSLLSHFFSVFHIYYMLC